MRISDWSSDVCSSDLAKRKIVASLLRLRAKADFTQKELAERAGWHPSFVCRLESFPREGEQLYMPDLQTLMVYAQVCGSNLAMMFGEAEAGGLHITESVSLSRDARFAQAVGRSEAHTSELQSLIRISYVVFCLHKNNTGTF